ncbi:predicted protein [Coccidioides posadasii str. Silveira]|uniref:Predicted protein n=1 Tax=Coccidioides posadasii (strain RMSCC 757 / Silveira) TaxID=443226 RepID=E9DA95_COCPS|nr:predicted protein [Coccidioides posadasii str. Silveira]
MSNTHEYIHGAPPPADDFEGGDVQWHNGVGTLAVRIGHKNTPIGKRVRRREGDRDIRTHNTGSRTRPSACGKCWLGRNLRYLIPQRNQRKRSYGYGHFLEALRDLRLLLKGLQLDLER